MIKGVIRSDSFHNFCIYSIRNLQKREVKCLKKIIQTLMRFIYQKNTYYHRSTLQK
jgi:predicted ATP-dependent Lon-type protease